MGEGRDLYAPETGALLLVSFIYFQKRCVWVPAFAGMTFEARFVHLKRLPGRAALPALNLMTFGSRLRPSTGSNSCAGE